MSKNTARSTAKIKQDILENFLPDVAFDGWSWQGIKLASKRCGYHKSALMKAFPGGVVDVIDYFALWIDETMLAELGKLDPEQMRVRDRVKAGIMLRFEVLAPFKEAERLAISYMSVPLRQARAVRMIWRSADCIWEWAGDTAKDYNRYTKRGLLSGVMGSASLVWLNDDTQDMSVTSAFVDRRIENVMQLGRLIGKIKKAS